jgi:hypothetical protein
VWVAALGLVQREAEGQGFDKLSPNGGGGSAPLAQSTRHPGLDPGSIFVTRGEEEEEEGGCRIKSGMTML